MRFSFIWIFLIPIFAVFLDVGYMLSRVYEGAFICWQYNYLGIERPEYFVDFSYGRKIVCLREELTPQMDDFLHAYESIDALLLSKRRGDTTSKVLIDGKEYIVKMDVRNGFLKNLFQMNHAVTIWNNLHWARDLGIPAVFPVAFVESRGLFSSTSMVLYPFEGVSGIEHVAKVGKASDEMVGIVRLLKERKVIHNDLRAKNMVCLDDGSVKLIDVGMMHRYPCRSYVYNRRMVREERWLEEEINSILLQ